jgi:hypothetical protein
MRKWLVSLTILGLASAAATAQTLPGAIGGCGQQESIGYDNGAAGTSWKVRNPTGHKDFFNVDFDGLAGSLATVEGVGVQTWQSSSSGNFGLRFIALCPDNLAVDSLGHTPDILNPLAKLGGIGGAVAITGEPGTAAGFCPGMVVYDTPDVAVTSATNTHGVVTFNTSDSSTWLCSSFDFSDPTPHSYFTTTKYTSPAIALSGSSDLLVRLFGSFPDPAGGSAHMTVNNSLGPVSVPQTGNVITTLWSSASVQPTLYLQGAIITGFPFIPLPQILLATGLENFVPISDLTQGTLCGPIASSAPCPPVGLSFAFGAFYVDNDDLKPNGKGKIKSTNFVGVTIVAGNTKVCYPCLCFGEVDDGVLDGTIWKVQPIAGPLDYFNNRIENFDSSTGTTCTVGNPVTSVTAIEMASWDFCGTGPTWASIGIYTANTALDSTGNTPDLASPVVTATTLSMAPFASDFSYPATVYDFPDIFTSTNSALASSPILHVAAQWTPGDSCTWMGSDTDGADDDGSSTNCAPNPPNAVSTVSFFSSNGYTTPALAWSAPPFTPNMMMKIDFF